MGERIHSIDSLRAIAVFFVVIAHVQPFAGFGIYGNYIYFVLDTIGQFDVPFFFVTSGYFLTSKLDSGSIKSTVRSSFQKLSSLYLFGISLYISAVTFTTGIALLSGRKPGISPNGLFENLSPVGVIYYGDAIAPPLWFLTALFFAICLVSLFVTLEKTRYLLPVAATAHVLGLIGQSYPMIAKFPVPTRDVLFFGFFYVALGFWIRSAQWSPSTNRRRMYFGMIIVALVGQIAEQYAVNYLLRGLTISQGTHIFRFHNDSKAYDHPRLSRTGLRSWPATIRSRSMEATTCPSPFETFDNTFPNGSAIRLCPAWVRPFWLPT
jgi:peptidoglycan/LPS O-acetylase OafA/YrhL